MDTAEIRAVEVLKRLMPNDRPIGVELGVYRGDMSAQLLRRREFLFLYMIDSWAPSVEQDDHYRETGDKHALMDYQEQIRHQQAAYDVTEFASTRRKIIPRRTSECLALFADWELDFVFIDADHSYEGVRRDVENWRHKVKPGGLLCGHDYNDPVPTSQGVKKAVDEAVKYRGWTLDLGENFTWFVRL